MPREFNEDDIVRDSHGRFSGGGGGGGGGKSPGERLAAWSGRMREKESVVASREAGVAEARGEKARMAGEKARLMQQLAAKRENIARARAQVAFREQGAAAAAAQLEELRGQRPPEPPAAPAPAPRMSREDTDRLVRSVGQDISSFRDRVASDPNFAHTREAQGLAAGLALNAMETVRAVESHPADERWGASRATGTTQSDYFQRSARDLWMVANGFRKSPEEISEIVSRHAANSPNTHSSFTAGGRRPLSGPPTMSFPRRAETAPTPPAPAPAPRTPIAAPRAAPAVSTPAERTRARDRALTEYQRAAQTAERTGRAEDHATAATRAKELASIVATARTANLHTENAARHAAAARGETLGPRHVEEARAAVSRARGGEVARPATSAPVASSGNVYGLQNRSEQALSEAHAKNVRELGDRDAQNLRAMFGDKLPTKEHFAKGYGLSDGTHATVTELSTGRNYAAFTGQHYHTDENGVKHAMFRAMTREYKGAPDQEGAHVYHAHLNVNPEFRSTGVGKQVLANSVRLNHELGYREIRTTPAGSHQAIPYEQWQAESKAAKDNGEAHKRGERSFADMKTIAKSLDRGYIGPHAWSSMGFKHGGSYERSFNDYMNSHHYAEYAHAIAPDLAKKAIDAHHADLRARGRTVSTKEQHDAALKKMVETRGTKDRGRRNDASDHENAIRDYDAIKANGAHTGQAQSRAIKNYLSAPRREGESLADFTNRRNAASKIESSIDHFTQTVGGQGRDIVRAKTPAGTEVGSHFMSNYSDNPHGTWSVNMRTDKKGWGIMKQRLGLTDLPDHAT